MENLLPANKTKIQKKLSKYNKKTEFADALHILRYTRGLKAPKGVRRFLEWCAEMNGEANIKNGVGAFFYKIENIAEGMNCSIRTVEDAFKWLKKYGFLHVIRAWDYEEGNYGTAYKVFADIKSIKAMVHAIITKDKQRIEEMIKTSNDEIEGIFKKIVGSTVGSVVGSDSEEKSDIPKDEPTKNSTDILPNIKNQYKNIKYNKSIKETDSFSKQSTVSNQPKKKKERKPNEYINYIFSQGILVGLSEKQKREFEKRIHIAVKRTKMSLEDAKIQSDVIEACQNFIKKYEKDRNNLTDDYYGALYKCIENEICTSLMRDFDIDTTEINKHDLETLFGEEKVENWKYRSDTEGKDGYEDDEEKFVQNFIRENWFKPMYFKINKNMDDMTNEWYKLIHPVLKEDRESEEESHGEYARGEFFASLAEMAITKEVPSNTTSPSITFEAFKIWQENRNQKEYEDLPY